MESLEQIAQRYKRNGDRAVWRVLYGERGKRMIDLSTPKPRAEPERPWLPTPWAHLFVREGFALRAQFSASQLDTWYGCNYAWGLRYLLGLRKPEPEWGIDGSHLDPRDRSLAFGKALHSRLEDYFNGRAVDWTDEIGSRALSALPYLPQSPPVLTEQPCSFDSRRVLPDLDRPVSIVGFKDLVDPDVTHDYKTTGQVGGRFQKSAADLIQDPAANFYLLDDMNRLGTNERNGNWVYIQSKGPIKAEPVRFTIKRERAEPIVRMMVVQGAVLREEIERFVEGTATVPIFDAISHLLKNTNTCKKYSGCEYHHSKGGPCRAELSAANTIPASALIGLREPSQSNNNSPQGCNGDPNMAQSIQDRLNAAQAAAQQQQRQPSQQQVAAAPAFNPGAQGFAPPGQQPPAQGFGPPAQQQPPTFGAPPQGGFNPQGMPAPPSFPSAPPVPPQAPPPVAPGQQAPPFGGFGGPPTPTQQPAPFMGSPEQQFAAPPGAVPLPTQAAPRKTRRTKAQIAADNAAAQSGAPTFSEAAPSSADDEEEDTETQVLILLRKSNGETITICAPDETIDYLLGLFVKRGLLG